MDGPIRSKLSFSIRRKTQVAQVSNSPIFDKVWYAKQINGLTSSSAAAHYLNTGWREGRDPSPYFSTSWYLKTYTDVRNGEVCPLVHFMKHGAKEGRSTSPFFQAQRMARSMGLADHGEHPLLVYLRDWQKQPWPDITLFDIAYFLEQLPAEVREVRREPFALFMSEGMKLSADPHPLFSLSFYLEQNPDVQASGKNPLDHFVMIGGAELRDPHPHFHSRFYVSQIAHLNPDNVGIPLSHYLSIGAKWGLDPNEGFSTSDYLLFNPDVKEASINPLVHYVVHGLDERRPTRLSRRSTLAPAAGASRNAGLLPGKGRWQPLTVVIPTYNRLGCLKATLEACELNRGGVPLEYVIVDDGSTDGTYDFLRQLSFPESILIPLRTQNRGPGSARNEGAQVASHDVILFLGDDIRPQNDDFFRAHSGFHQRYDSPDAAMLGKVVWPSSRLLPNNFVMSHIQGRQGEQFGFSDMLPYEHYDFRFFYTSNISVKRNIVDDWCKNGFSSDFKLYGFEDTEFAYRIGKRMPNFYIYYDPMSIGCHYHPYAFDNFVQRQLHAGRMANVFIKKHPEVADILNLSEILSVIKLRSNAADTLVADNLAVFEGIRAWINILEAKGRLGIDGYHKELISSFFEFAFLTGYINAVAEREDNLGAGLNFAFEKFLKRVRRSISHEVADWFG